jgi:hypothetical protein
MLLKDYEALGGNVEAIKPFTLSGGGVKKKLLSRIVLNGQSLQRMQQIEGNNGE